MNNDVRYKLEQLLKDRTYYGRQVGLASPKGHSSSTYPSHNSRLYDAKNRVISLRKKLAELLHPYIQKDRRNGSSWKNIMFRYNLSQTVLTELRNHRLFDDVH